MSDEENQRCLLHLRQLYNLTEDEQTAIQRPLSQSTPSGESSLQNEPMDQDSSDDEFFDCLSELPIEESVELPEESSPVPGPSGISRIAAKNSGTHTHEDSMDEDEPLTSSQIIESSSDAELDEIKGFGKSNDDMETDWDSNDEACVSADDVQVKMHRTHHVQEKRFGLLVCEHFRLSLHIIICSLPSF